MDGVHDMGGAEGFGSIVVEEGEPPFHAPWEGRVHGMMLNLSVTGGLAPGFRYAIERMGAVPYLTTSYYEHWLHAVQDRLLGSGTVTDAELVEWERRIGAGATVPTRDAPEAAALLRSIFRPLGGAPREGPAPRWKVGDRVRVWRESPRGHTRCPRYVRGAVGVVEALRRVESLNDAAVNDGVDRPEMTYGVRFDARELWGEGTEPGCSVVVDLWESYLEEANA